MTSSAKQYLSRSLFGLSILCFLTVCTSVNSETANAELALSDFADTNTEDSNSNKQSIVIYTEAQYRPYSFVEDSKLRGIYVDLVDEVNQRMKDYQISLFASPWKEAKSAMRKGEGVGILGAYFQGHDEPYLYPYSIPIHAEEVVVVCSEASGIAEDANWPDDYENRVVANVRGYDAWLRDAGRGLKYRNFVRFFEVPNTDIALRMVAKDRVDCALFERYAYYASMQFLEASGKYNPDVDSKTQVTSSLLFENAYLAFSEPVYTGKQNSMAQDFKKEFDVALFTIIDDGTFDAILDTYREAE